MERFRGFLDLLQLIRTSHNHVYVNEFYELQALDQTLFVTIGTEAIPCGGCGLSTRPAKVDSACFDFGCANAVWCLFSLQDYTAFLLERDNEAPLDMGLVCSNSRTHFQEGVTEVAQMTP
jgi:hypothetical protein